jgi:hypothetical protein
MWMEEEEGRRGVAVLDLENGRERRPPGATLSCTFSLHSLYAILGGGR